MTTLQIVHTPPAKTQPGLSLQTMLSSCTTPPAGCYYIGLADDGLPVLGSHRIPVLLATSDFGNGLLSLSQTAVATATVFNRSSLNLIVVTEAPGIWQNRARTVHPGQVPDLRQAIQRWQPVKNQWLLIIMDRFSLRWGLSLGAIQELASMPFVNLLITAQPVDALNLLNRLPKDFEKQLPNNRGVALATFSKLILGHINNPQIKNALAHLTPLTTNLEYGQFALRHQSRWLIFTTATV